MLVGEGRSYLGALVVLNSHTWESIAGEYNLDPDWRKLARNQKLEEILVQRIGLQIKEFPGYARLYRVALAQEP